MTTQSLSSFIGQWLPRLEAEMQELLRYPVEDKTEEQFADFYGMMQYHMGWTNAQFQPQQLPTGKRLRPMMCLMACEEVGGDPVQALPAASAIEILHNFSLIHDDIEDGDETRRHRPTVWKLTGIPLAINIGDGKFALAFQAIQNSSRRGVEAKTTLAALNRFTQTCIELTQGQHMDMSFEQRSQVQVGEYVRMIEGKTASLVGASVSIGALIGNGTEEQINALARFGQSVGLAFQVQDDILGIWGDPEVTGKAAGNDILRQKKSLPLLYALNHEKVGPKLLTIWQGGFGDNQLPRVLELLDEAQARQFAEEQVAFHHTNAMTALEDALGEGANKSKLRALAESLVNRSS